MLGWVGVGEGGSFEMFVHLCDVLSGRAKGNVGKFPQNIETVRPWC